VERRAANPLVHPRLLRNRPYVALIAVGTIGNMGVNIFILMATFDLQVIRGFSAQQAGLLFVSGSVGVALSGPVGGWLCARFPATRVLAFATIVGAGGLTLISTASILPVYLAALALAGLACGMAYSVTQIGVQSVVPPQQSGEATSFMLMPLIALGGLAVVITSGIVEQIGGGTPTAGGVSVVLLGSAAVMAVAGAALLLGERMGFLHEADAAASVPGTPA
ncbi:MAG TPA: MFS transporter, partial [Rhodoglobus sp.]|nr:MFS transporter [Rhodoglobus sp.]